MYTYRGEDDECCFIIVCLVTHKASRKTLEDVKRCVDLNSKPIANMNEIEQLLEFASGNRRRARQGHLV